MGGYEYTVGRNTWNQVDPTGVKYRKVMWSGYLGGAVGSDITDVEFLMQNAWVYSRQEQVDAGFDFSSGCSGTGSSTQEIPKKNAKQLVGSTLPPGLKNLRVRLEQQQFED